MATLSAPMHVNIPGHMPSQVDQNIQQQYTSINYKQYSPVPVQQFVSVPQSFINKISTELKCIKSQQLRLDTIEENLRIAYNRLEKSGPRKALPAQKCTKLKKYTILECGC